MSNPNEFETKWPEMNKALEIAGPLTRGKFGLIGGITNSYKTGLLKELFYQMCTGKSAAPVSPQRTPKILYITADESDTSMVEGFIDFARIQNDLTRSNGDRDLAEDDLEFLRNTLNEKGYETELLLMPSTPPQTVDDLCGLINDFITDESEVHAVFIDGLDKFNQEPLSDHVVALKTLKAYAAKQNILLVGTHQLSFKSMADRREGFTGIELLKLAYGHSHWAFGGEQIANLVDVEIFVDLHRQNPTVAILCGSHNQGIDVPSDDCLFTITFPHW